MIEKIDNNQISEILKESSPKQSDPAKTLTGNEIDASLQVNYDSLIEKALETTLNDTDVVQNAQKLLSTGQLESPENIQQAAENIINFGI